jgi:hypothetical protein
LPTFKVMVDLVQLVVRVFLILSKKLTI